MGDIMSFIYAEKGADKVDNQGLPYLFIYGDTKFTPVPGAPNIKNWGKRTFEIVSRYGLVKSMIGAPKCCVSFAGNDISYAHDLLTFVYTEKRCSYEKLLNKALAIHSSVPENAIEFLICTVDNAENAHIHCIKNGKLDQDCPQAWIGSPFVHKALQAQRDFSVPKTEQSFSLSQFQTAIEKASDDSVGGFITDIRYDYNNRTFAYSERLETHTGKDQIVKPGECIRLYDNAADGGYLVHYDESWSMFSLQIDQGDLSIVYTNESKYAEPDSINDHTKYFMLPILKRTSTGEPIEAIVSVK